MNKHSFLKLFNQVHVKLFKLFVALISCLYEKYILICNINNLMWQILALNSYCSNHFISNRSHCAAFASRLTCCCLRLQLLVLLLLLLVLCCQRCGSYGIGDKMQIPFELQQQTAAIATGNARPTTVDTGQQQLATCNCCCWQVLPDVDFDLRWRFNWRHKQCLIIS